MALRHKVNYRKRINTKEKYESMARRRKSAKCSICNSPINIYDFGDIAVSIGLICTQCYVGMNRCKRCDRKILHDVCPNCKIEGAKNRRYLIPKKPKNKTAE